MARIKNTNLEKEAIKLLVLELSGLNGAEFVAHLDQELPYDIQTKMENALDKYVIEHLPVQHILGYTYFFGYKMLVDSHVLIPRPETEELVGYVLEKYDEVFNNRDVKVVDVGTGSGAIAIALNKEEPHMEMYATDISEEALQVAIQNANINDAKCTFIQGDMLKPLINEHLKFDILVSNPPYIPNDEFVEDIVINNEPHVALFGGSDGMRFYEIILKDAHKILNYPNIIAFEHSYSKGAEMVAMAKHYFPKGKIELIKDLSGKDRMTIIVNKE